MCFGLFVACVDWETQERSYRRRVELCVFDVELLSGRALPLWGGWAGFPVLGGKGGARPLVLVLVVW